MAQQNGRIVILSDTHLGPPGRGAVDADRLRPLWQGADHLIINGDVAEIHDHTHRAEAAKQILKLQVNCERGGVRLTLLSGNHDPLLTDHRFLELCGGEVFLTHGDVLHQAISPWSEHHRRLHKLHTEAQERLSPSEQNTFDSRLSCAQYASHFKWDEFAHTTKPQAPGWQRPLHLANKLMRVAWYWHTLPKTAGRFAEQHCPHARFFIFGHIHRAGIWKNGRRVVINTGAYDFPFNPQAVVIERNQLSVYRVLRGRNERYQFASGAKARFELKGNAAASAA